MIISWDANISNANGLSYTDEKISSNDKHKAAKNKIKKAQDFARPKV